MTSTATPAPVHTANIEPYDGPALHLDWRAWCPCGWSGDWWPDEDAAQVDAATHVANPPTTPTAQEG